VDVDTATFDEDVIDRSRERPVVVDFWADWCGPCHALTPVLESAAEDRDVQLVKVDVDANQQLAERYGVRGIPAVKAFRNGHVVAEFTGVRPRAAVEQFLDQLSGPSEAAKLIADLGLQDVTEAYEAGDHERALARLLEELQTATGDERDRLKRAMVALFGELGQENPVVVDYRRRLATTLY
jgi:putative thioredoxin